MKPAPETALEAGQSCRIDLWLWRARFARTRSLAAAMVERGAFRELRRNGQVWLQREQVDAGTLRVRNGADDYELTIESVAGGVQDP